MRRRKQTRQIISAVAVAAALAVTVPPGASGTGTSRQYRYVTEPSAGVSVVGQPAPIRVVAADTSVQVTVDDAVSPDDRSVGLVIRSGREAALRFFGCVTPSQTVTVSGLTRGDKVSLEVGESMGSSYLLLLPYGCTGKSTTGLMAIAGVR